MPKLTIKPFGKTVEVSESESLLLELKKNGYNIKSSCGGCASCGDCIIEVISGDKNLTMQTFEETRLLGNVFHITKERLSCQTKITGDVTIDISNHKQVFVKEKPKTLLRKEKSPEEKEFKPKEPKELGFKKPRKFTFKEEE